MTQAIMTAVAGVPREGPLASDVWQSYVGTVKEAGLKALALPADAPSETFSQAAEAELAVAVLHSVTGRAAPHLADADPSRRELAHACLLNELAQAAQMRARALTVSPCEPRGPSFGPDLPEYADVLHSTYAALRSLVGDVARAGVAAAIEVGGNGFLLSPVEARELFDRVGSPDIGAALDVDRAAHLGCCADWVRTLRHRIVCVKTSVGSEIDGRRLRALLDEVGYAGPVICEGPPASAVSRLADVVGVS